MQTKKRHLLIALLIAYVFVSIGCVASPHPNAAHHAADLTLIDQYTLAGPKHLVHGYPPFDSSGNMNVVVEIPTGTHEKWEVDKATGHLKWEFKKGKPRVVSYLGYPGNYGMIPGTLLPKELGGDGDPLDVIVIGRAVPRGSVVAVRPIGVLKLLDKGEQDDKIIAVLPNSPLGVISDIEELNRKFKGVTDILETWFSHYKGPGKIESKGFAGVADAHHIIEAAAAAYRDNWPNTR